MIAFKGLEDCFMSEQEGKVVQARWGLIRKFSIRK
jgi:hypothetical protein